MAYLLFSSLPKSLVHLHLVIPYWHFDHLNLYDSRWLFRTVLVSLMCLSARSRKIVNIISYLKPNLSWFHKLDDNFVGFNLLCKSV